MATQIITRLTDEGIECTLESSAKGIRTRVGIIKPHFVANGSSDSGSETYWYAKPDADKTESLNGRIFASLEAAEYYILAAACEYVKLS